MRTILQSHIRELISSSFFLFSRYDDHQVIEDAAKVGIPVVAIVDTDCFPNIITYPIPGNDDSIESVQLYLHLFKQAILIGKKYKTQMAQHAEEMDKKRRLSRATEQQQQ